jgi:uncharacterized protein YndB with AHSA1/START domain
MKSLGHLALVLGAISAVSGVASAQTTNKKSGAQEFSATVEIAAPPEKVWKALTDAAGFGGFLKMDYKGGDKKLEKVGDHAMYKVWGDDADVVVSVAKPNQELRIALEPANASYICACRFVITPSGKGSKLMYMERYSESGAQSAEDLAKQVKDMNEGLAKLKAAAEGK